MEDILSRNRILIGEKNVRQLQQSHVMIIGLGGVGSWAAEALGRMGIGCISLVDGDRVEASNINRQLGALHSTLGLAKTMVWAERLHDINPQLYIQEYMERYTQESAERILANKPDILIDAIDSLPDKKHLIRYCQEHGISSFHSMGAGNRLDPSRIKRGTLDQTKVCPLARKLRRELKEEGFNSRVEVVYSLEQPYAVNSDDGSRLGSMVYVTSVFGLLLAEAAATAII